VIQPRGHLGDYHERSGRALHSVAALCATLRKKARLPSFAAGTGNPYFTTDTAATLRRHEIGPAKRSFKGTKSMASMTKTPRSTPMQWRYGTM